MEEQYKSIKTTEEVNNEKRRNQVLPTIKILEPSKISELSIKSEGFAIFIEGRNDEDRRNYATNIKYFMQSLFDVHEKQ